ncbi:hypothetical protein HUG17_6065 [Dermatophagoides farinae]|uniref:Uncharacterized protein n=1 Tax=Dermatophagoides farinae TaxID=6954 RepID=A0A9D4SJ96_DERFA|nr:hypothetical protein HUG17_6065 [Dermatophagoides farinae]
MISSQPPSQHQQPAPQHPPLRSKSLTARITNNVQHLPTTTMNESIYSNRKICFNDQIQSTNNQRPKENIYTEIQIKSSSNTNDVRQIQTNDDDSNNDDTDNTNANVKPSRFSRLYRAFKLFGLTTGNNNRTNNNSGSSSSPSSTPAKNSSPVKSIAKNLLNLKSNTSTMMNVKSVVGDSTPVTTVTTSSGATSLKISNGTTVVGGGGNVPINPINGQPLTRPPHSHRFHHQNATQWTQV